MTRRFLLLPWAALIGLCGAAAAFASNASPEPACITAGRLDGDGRWAPQFRAVRLLDEAGRAIAAPGQTALARVRSVELTEPALLSRCDGNQPLARKTYIAILDIIEPPRPKVAEGQIPPDDPTVATYRRRLSSVVLS
jgi:hypothetical protein